MPEHLMPEPRSRRVRHIPMRHLAWLAAVLLMAGCGSADGQSGEEAQSDNTDSTSATVGKCPADAPAVQVARTIATVDLDGDGTDDAVRMTAPGGECGDTVFARLSSGYVSAPANDGPPVTNAFGVQLPGRTGQLLVTKSDHPRGGYQLRLYAAVPSGLTEVQVDGHPLVPFVATDVQEHPFSIECADGGLVLTEAVAHEPIGVVPAWDIKRTTYVVDGTSVQKGTTAEVADNVLTNQLAAKYPDLVKHAAFTTCRS